MKIIGIDPGKSGAYCILNENTEIISKGMLPLIGKEYDVNSIYQLIKECDHVNFEKPGVIQGVSKSSVASLANAVGLLQGIVVGAQKPYTMIPPKEWQAVMWRNVAKQYKPAKTEGKPRKEVDTKATSTLAALRIYPTENFKLSPTGKSSINYNDGMIDAALIARYYFDKKTV